MLPTCSPTWLYQFILLSIVFGNFCFFSSFPSGFKKLYQSDKYEMVLLCISLNTNEVEYLLMFVVHLCFLFFFSLMNHLFEQDKMSPHRFLLYRKWNISNILTFLFNKISFSLVPGTAFHFRIHVSVTHMHPLQPKEHT